MESVRSPALLLEWLLVGLRFAYSCADKHNPVLEALQRMKEDMEDENVRKRVARLQKFLKERAAAGDNFTFVADGAEALDTCDYRGIEKMDAGELKDTFLTLKAIIAPYKIVWGMSPKANQAQAAALSGSEQVEIYHIRGFTKTKDVDFFAGFHPQFLDELDGTCMEVARIKQAGRHKSGVVWGDTVSVAPPVELEPQEVSSLLKDEEDWQRVLLEFINRRTISSICRSVQEVIQRLDDAKAICDLHRKTETIDTDPRYSLSEDKFCSCFMEQIYREEFRKARSCPQQEHLAWWNMHLLTAKAIVVFIFLKEYQNDIF
ncbi:hypothetical protein SELMODRAFT_427973 [Selaginella moellendorffii]|uniref:Uncharacterized protein n=1 Tax=Selaginella moellendorffii TaxID=88036 RepID=D8T1A7_SELML|nr:hypothetical protein SELMODRAFT_427973 [Selaginella moellendorffii]